MTLTVVIEQLDFHSEVETASFLRGIVTLTRVRKQVDFCAGENTTPISEKKSDQQEQDNNLISVRIKAQDRYEVKHCL